MERDLVVVSTCDNEHDHLTINETSALPENPPSGSRSVAHLSSKPMRKNSISSTSSHSRSRSFSKSPTKSPTLRPTLDCLKMSSEIPSLSLSRARSRSKSTSNTRQRITTSSPPEKLEDNSKPAENLPVHVSSSNIYLDSKMRTSSSSSIDRYVNILKIYFVPNSSRLLKKPKSGDLEKLCNFSVHFSLSYSLNDKYLYKSSILFSASSVLYSERCEIRIDKK
jgi:hypothetical protein